MRRRHPLIVSETRQMRAALFLRLSLRAIRNLDYLLTRPALTPLRLLSNPPPLEGVNYFKVLGLLRCDVAVHPSSHRRVRCAPPSFSGSLYVLYVVWTNCIHGLH